MVAAGFGRPLRCLENVGQAIRAKFEEERKPQENKARSLLGKIFVA